jgi:hypothetical protein
VDARRYWLLVPPSVLVAIALTLAASGFVLALAIPIISAPAIRRAWRKSCQPGNGALLDRLEVTRLTAASVLTGALGVLLGLGHGEVPSISVGWAIALAWAVIVWTGPTARPSSPTWV